jgi:serine/threonine protein kinase
VGRWTQSGAREAGPADASGRAGAVSSEEIVGLFGQARELTAEARASWLLELSRRDPETAALLAKLLRADEREDSLLERRPTELSEPPAAEEPPREIGPYRIVREIGRGGMGRVFLAELRGEGFIRRVAIKRLERRDSSPATERRFHDEVKILAGLEHSGIARFLDGGRAEDGGSYLVLEYVEGLDLLAHARDQGLNLERRLRLFVEVLEAVAYAHGQRVLHRDLKPGNVLVGADGRTKLLDFGISKLLEPEGTVDTSTRTEHRALTPAYASPEQIRGNALTIASDIYSLGVMLYELLTGTRPFEATSGDRRDLERAVLDEEPVPPSTAARRHLPISSETGSATSPGEGRLRLGRDLDAICLKALRKEPELRYASASEMARDIASFLEGRPVSARRGGASYRFATLARKYRAALLLASVSALVATALAVPVVRYLAARPRPDPLHGRSSARPALSKIGELSARFAENPNRPETAAIGLELIDALLAAGRGSAAIGAVARLRQLPDPLGKGPRIDLAESRAALAVSEFQRAAAAAEAAREGAERTADAALARRARLAHARALFLLAPPEEVERRLGALYTEAAAAGDEAVAAETLLVRAAAARRGSRAEEATQLLDEALPRLVALGSRSLEVEALTLRGRFEGESGRLDNGLATTQGALEMAVADGDLAGEASALLLQGTLFNWQGNGEAALVATTKAAQKLRLTGNRAQLVRVLVNLVTARVERGEFLQAEAAIAEAEPLVRELGSEVLQGAVFQARGYLEEQRGNVDAARVSYQAAISSAREAGSPAVLVMYLHDLAWLEVSEESSDAAEAAAREAVELYERGGDERSAIEVQAVLAWVEAKRGNATAARLQLARLATRAAEGGSDSARFVVLVAEARVAELSGDLAGAIELRRRICALAEGFDSPGLLLTHRLGLAKALALAGRHAEAVALSHELLPQAESLGLAQVIQELHRILSPDIPPAPRG